MKLSREIRLCFSPFLSTNINQRSFLCKHLRVHTPHPQSAKVSLLVYIPDSPKVSEFPLESFPLCGIMNRYYASPDEVVGVELYKVPE